jgi:DNA-binding response OmpR family regulator
MIPVSDRKLLLADDSLTIQKVVNLTFADEGIDVVCASSGEAAMSKLSEFVPDLVLADVNMPGPNGYKICEIIRQREETKDVPVILLVGSFEPFDEAEFRRVGANDYMTKPFQSIRHLVTRVSELLDERSTGSGAQNEDALLRGDSAADEDEDIDDLYRQSFTETIELPQAAPSIAHLGDPGMDDELIETQIVGPPSGPKLEGFDFSAPADIIEENDYTEFSLVDEVGGEAGSDPDAVTSVEENLTGSAVSAAADDSSEADLETPEVTDTSEARDVAAEEDVSLAGSVPDVFENVPEPLDLEESLPAEEAAPSEESASMSSDPGSVRSDPLEIPFSEGDSTDLAKEKGTLDLYSDEVASNDLLTAEEDPLSEMESAPPSVVASETTENGSAPPLEIEEPPAASPEISSQMIEAIANMVAEKISDRVVRRIAWQIVPEIVESVARDLAEKDQKI